MKGVRRAFGGRASKRGALSGHETDRRINTLICDKRLCSMRSQMMIGRSQYWPVKAMDIQHMFKLLSLSYHLTLDHRLVTEVEQLLHR